MENGGGLWTREISCQVKRAVPNAVSKLNEEPDDKY
jgi:hypothetical protein